MQNPSSDNIKPAAGNSKLILLVGLITYGIGQSLLYVIFGPLARDVGLNETQFGILISASNVVLVFSSPRWGRASDSMGRKTVFVIGLLGFAAGYGGLAFGIQAGLWGWIVATPLFLSLLAARLIYGIFAGGVQPAAAAYIADTTDKANRAKGMALVAATGGIGSILGPAVGGALSIVSPVFPMYAAAGFALLAAIWAIVSLEEPSRHVAPPDGPKLQWRDKRVFPYLLGWFSIFLVFTAIQVVTAFIVEDQLGVVGRADVIRMTSLALLSMGIVTVIVQVGVLQIVKIQPRFLLRFAFIFFGLAVFLLAHVYEPWQLYGVYALMGLTASLAMPSLSAAASLGVEPHEQGALAGLLAAAPTMGMIFGPAMSGALYSWRPESPMLFGAAVLIMTGVYFWFVDVPLTDIEKPGS